MSKQSFKNFISGVTSTAKKIIVEMQKAEKLTNEEKKQKLDEAIVAFLQANISNYHFFVRFAIQKLLIPYVSEFTQAIFDLLKARIQGVTKEDKPKEATPVGNDNGKNAGNNNQSSKANKNGGAQE